MVRLPGSNLGQPAAQQQMEYDLSWVGQMVQISFQMGLKGFCFFKWASDPFGLASTFSFKQGATTTSF
jgi:hypothetical protein